MCIVILTKIFELLGIILYHMIHSPFSRLLSVPRQVWEIPNVFEIACGRDRLVPDDDNVTTIIYFEVLVNNQLLLKLLGHLM
jgi:hypothetical protein